jgi:hypothetical protein
MTKVPLFVHMGDGDNPAHLARSQAVCQIRDKIYSNNFNVLERVSQSRQRSYITYAQYCSSLGDIRTQNRHHNNTSGNQSLSSCRKPTWGIAGRTFLLCRGGFGAACGEG